jgi:DNA recombination protein RmuC
MDFYIIFFLVVAGGISGYFLSYFIHHRKSDAKKYKDLSSAFTQLEADYRVGMSKLEMKDEELAAVKGNLDISRLEIVDLNRELAAASSDLKNLSDKLAGQQQEYENNRRHFINEFKALASEVLTKETETFTVQNLRNMETILKPLSEKIKDFEKKVEETYDRESKQRFSLGKEVQRLADLNLQISRDAQNLTTALKGENKTQGNWGELILESILEKSGLVKDREFVVQKSFQTETGKRLQPDVVLFLPGNKNIVIDSKVSLTSYEKYVAAVDESDKQTALKGHLFSVKKHIDELAGKNYQNIYSLNSPDFVILFLPVEPAYFTALQHDADLWHYAYNKGVLLVGPTNLIATVKMIVNLWQQEYQTRNVKLIAEESGKLYDKFAGFLKDLKEVGNKLSAANTAYGSAMNKLSEGKGNLISKAMKLKELGAKTKTDISSDHSGLIPENRK